MPRSLSLASTLLSLLLVLTACASGGGRDAPTLLSGPQASGEEDRLGNHDPKDENLFDSAGNAYQLRWRGDPAKPTQSLWTFRDGEPQECVVDWGPYVLIEVTEPPNFFVEKRGDGWYRCVDNELVERMEDWYSIVRYDSERGQSCWLVLFAESDELGIADQLGRISNRVPGIGHGQVGNILGTDDRKSLLALYDYRLQLLVDKPQKLAVDGRNVFVGSRDGLKAVVDADRARFLGSSEGYEQIEPVFDPHSKQLLGWFAKDDASSGSFLDKECETTLHKGVVGLAAVEVLSMTPASGGVQEHSVAVFERAGGGFEVFDLDAGQVIFEHETADGIVALAAGQLRAEQDARDRALLAERQEELRKQVTAAMTTLRMTSTASARRDAARELARVYAWADEYALAVPEVASADPAAAAAERNSSPQSHVSKAMRGLYVNGWAFSGKADPSFADGLRDQVIASLTLAPTADAFFVLGAAEFLGNFDGSLHAADDAVDRAMYGRVAQSMRAACAFDRSNAIAVGWFDYANRVTRGQHTAADRQMETTLIEPWAERGLPAVGVFFKVLLDQHVLAFDGEPHISEHPLVRAYARGWAASNEGRHFTASLEQRKLNRGLLVDPLPVIALVRKLVEDKIYIGYGSPREWLESLEARYYQQVSAQRCRALLASVQQAATRGDREVLPELRSQLDAVLKDDPHSTWVRVVEVVDAQRRGDDEALAEALRAGLAGRPRDEAVGRLFAVAAAREHAAGNTDKALVYELAAAFTRNEPVAEEVLTNWLRNSKIASMDYGKLATAVQGQLGGLRKANEGYAAAAGYRYLVDLVALGKIAWRKGFTSAQAASTIADDWARAHDYERARAEIAAVMDSATDKEKIWLFKSLGYCAMQELRAIDERLDEIGLPWQLASSLAKERETAAQSAIESLDKALALGYPNRDWAHRQLGEANYRIGDMQAAITAAQQALAASDKPSLKSYNRLAWYLLNDHRFGEALAAYDEYAVKARATKAKSASRRRTARRSTAGSRLLLSWPAHSMRNSCPLSSPQWPANNRSPCNAN